MKTESIKLGELEIVFAAEIDMYSTTALWKAAGADQLRNNLSSVELDIALRLIKQL